MSLSTKVLQDSSSRPLRLEVRQDLAVREQYFRGTKYFVVKDPIGLKYFRLREEEYAILRYLDGRASLREIKERFDRDFAPQHIALKQLHFFVASLHQRGLVIAHAEQVHPLLERRAENLQQRRTAALTNVLAIRWRGFDPQALLDRLYPWTSWFFTKAAVLTVAAMALSALLLLLIRFETLAARLPAFHEFFGPGNWLWLGATMATVKVLHEFGHGLCCRHFRSECHQMGFMLLVFSPALYCDVSDSWLLPNKWHRAAIAAAGIYVEVTLASLATFLWWFSEPGLLNHLCLSVMFICSTGTILFNGNPLMRFDGYYILSDLIEIPNLSQKARNTLQNLLLGLCLGLTTRSDPYTPRGRAWLVTYALASVVYRWFITFSILLFLNKVFEPYGLKVVGQMLALAGVYGLLIQPLWQLFKMFHVPGRISEVKRPRLLATAALLAAGLAALVFLPLPHYIVCPLEVDADKAAEVYVDVPGRLVEACVQPGDLVAKGSRLALLDDNATLCEVARLEGLRREYRTQRDNLERESIFDPAIRREVLAAEAMLATVKQQLAEKQRVACRLELVSPREGIVYAAPSRDLPDAPSRLPRWSGAPTEPHNQGAFLEKRDVFCRVGDPRQLTAVLVIDQHDVELVQPGQDVVVQLDSQPWRTISSELKEVSRVEMEASPRRLSVHEGGELATRSDERGVQRTLHASYQGRVPLSDVGLDVPLGATGRAKIFTGWRPLGVRLWRFLEQTFHFEL
jgi:putative peptide zinc metalloprotease protein